MMCIHLWPQIYGVDGTPIHLASLAREQSLLCLTLSNMEDGTPDGTLLRLLASLPEESYERHVFERDVTTLLLTRPSLDLVTFTEEWVPHWPGRLYIVADEGNRITGTLGPSVDCPNTTPTRHESTLTSIAFRTY